MTGVTDVTGGGQGIGRAIGERLVGDGGSVVVELTADHLDCATAYADRIRVVTGDAGDDEVARHAAEQARSLGRLTGWVNNAAVLRDVSDHARMSVAITGCTRRAALRRLS